MTMGMVSRGARGRAETEREPPHQVLANPQPHTFNHHNRIWHTPYPTPQPLTPLPHYAYQFMVQTKPNTPSTLYLRCTPMPHYAYQFFQVIRV